MELKQKGKEINELIGRKEDCFRVRFGEIGGGIIEYFLFWDITKTASAKSTQLPTN